MKTDYDLDAMSKSELEKLRADVDTALKTLDTRRRADARKAVEEAAKQHGFKLDELMRDPKGKKKNPPKFHNPDNPDQTWTGKGRQPDWLKEKLQAGHSVDEFRI